MLEEVEKSNVLPVMQEKVQTLGNANLLCVFVSHLDLPHFPFCLSSQHFLTISTKEYILYAIWVKWCQDMYKLKQSWVTDEELTEEFYVIEKNMPLT